jgi:hypothetical protein
MGTFNDPCYNWGGTTLYVLGPLGFCWKQVLTRNFATSEGNASARGQDLPKNSPQKYTITLYDMKTWQPVDIEAPKEATTQKFFEPNRTNIWLLCWLNISHTSYILHITHYISHITYYTHIYILYHRICCILMSIVLGGLYFPVFFGVILVITPLGVEPENGGTQ